MAAAAAIGRYFCVEEEAIRQAIIDYHPDNNRSQREERATNTLIVDCYNANPSSMQVSMEHFMTEPLNGRSRKVMLLGDMRELGRWSEEEHRRIIRLAHRDNTIEVKFVGEEFGKALSSIDEELTSEHYADCDALLKALEEQPLRDALILIKASRGIGLERVLTLL